MSHRSRDEDANCTLEPSPCKSAEMESLTAPGLENMQRSKRLTAQLSPESASAPKLNGPSRGEDTKQRAVKGGTDCRFPNEPADKNLGKDSEQMRVLNEGESPGEALDPTHDESPPKNMKSELETSLDNEVLDSLSKETPQTSTACQGETKESLTNLDKIQKYSGSSSSEELLDVRCEHCLLPKKPPVTRAQLVNSADPKELFCCERAWMLSDFLLRAAVAEELSEETMTDRDPVVQKDQRLEHLEFQRSSKRQNCTAGPKEQVSDTICYRLSNDVWTAKRENSLPEMEIMDSENMDSVYGENVWLKKKTPFIKSYDSGKPFITIFPDGTGRVCYPSGNLAILVSAAHSYDFCYVILEDKELQPNIRAIFTTRGQSTCYHQNGLIWMNLTPLRGSYFSDTGALRKRWSWLEHGHHVHAPPCQPLRLTLSPNLEIHIQTQQCIYLTFTSNKHSIRLNVGAKFKLNQAKGLMLPGPDMVQRYLQLKSAEINALLQNIQSLITYQKTVSPWKVKPQHSLISQMERRRLPMKKQQSAKKTP